MLANPDNPGQEIVWLQRAVFADEGRSYAATVRDLISPLVLLCVNRAPFDKWQFVI